MRYGRAKWFSPDELDEVQARYYTDLTSGPRGARVVSPEGRLMGAFNARLLDPKVGNAIQQLGAILRFETNLSGREREFVILETANSERCNFEWSGHADLARKHGATEEELQAILDGTDVPTFTPEERVLRELAQSLIVDRDVSDDLFARADAIVGQPKIFDTISLVGYYQNTAVALRAWRVPLREGTTPVFPLPEWQRSQ